MKPVESPEQTPQAPARVCAAIEKPTAQNDRSYRLTKKTRQH